MNVRDDFRGVWEASLESILNDGVASEGCADPYVVRHDCPELEDAGHRNSGARDGRGEKLFRVGECVWC